MLKPTVGPFSSSALYLSAASLWLKPLFCKVEDLFPVTVPTSFIQTEGLIMCDTHVKQSQACSAPGMNFKCNDSNPQQNPVR